MNVCVRMVIIREQRVYCLEANQLYGQQREEQSATDVLLTTRTPCCILCALLHCQLATDFMIINRFLSSYGSLRTAL